MFNYCIKIHNCCYAGVAIIPIKVDAKMSDKIYIIENKDEIFT